MTTLRSLRVVHLSDLHLGQESKSKWRSSHVMGSAWKKNLQEIADDKTIDLVCFTGDLAFSGQPGQYLEATAFVDELLSVLKVPKSRFFCVPGNHDVDRKIAETAWEALRAAAGQVDQTKFARWMTGGAKPFGFDESWRDAVLSRQAAYRQWLIEMDLSALHPQNSAHGNLGYRKSVDLGLGAPLHVIGLDSAWLAGDEQDAGNLRVTDEQIGRLLTDSGATLQGWKLALVHHPLHNLADSDTAESRLAEFGVSLLLHGHLHKPKVGRWVPAGLGAQALNVSAAGCLYEHDRYPNSMQVLDLQLQADHRVVPCQVWFRSWSKNGHWHSDDSRYVGSEGGKLALVSAPAVQTSFVPGQFVGRAEALQQVVSALIPNGSMNTTNTNRCCVLEGMPGIGKSRLAEHFVQQHWAPAVGVTAGDEASTSSYTRLTLEALDASKAEPATALQLAQQLAETLRSPGPPDTVWQRLSAALQHGPRSKPVLLWIENVDSEAQAGAVGELINRLHGCTVLVTARFQKLGDASWRRVLLEPMPMTDAVALLMGEVEADGHPLTEQEARDLAYPLGCLPLALHIAASHLNLKLTPAAFLRKLRATGLNLAPAQPGDPRLTNDRARAVLKSSFELSWQTWCSQHNGVEHAGWQAALVALAHGPAAGMGLSLAAAVADIAEADYPNFASDAARLSLLTYIARNQHSQLHPLIAEFLWTQGAPDADAVLARMSKWFMPKLPATGDAAQGIAWRAVQAETDALVLWLNELGLEEGLEAAREGKSFAVLSGPHAAWISMCQRLLAQTQEPAGLSQLLFTLCQLMYKSGDQDGAVRFAELKREIDDARGSPYDSALASNVIADVLQKRGDFKGATLIWQKLLPVFEAHKADNAHTKTMGKIADAMQAVGELDEAVRIRRERELPVYEMQGDRRSVATTKGKLASVLELQGEFDEALRIRREEELPVYEELGEVPMSLNAKAQIAFVLLQRGAGNDRVEAEALLVLTFKEAKRLDMPVSEQIRALYKHAFGRDLPEAGEPE